MAADAGAESMALLALSAWSSDSAVVCGDACSEDEQEPSAARSAHADVRFAGGKLPRSATAADAVRVLTAEQAVAVFLARKERTGKRGDVANTLARRFGVAPRTIRDIWNLRTWKEVTQPLWSSDDFARVAKKASMKRGCPPPEARTPDAADGEWKLCAAWLTPGGEWERDDVLDKILASALFCDVFQ